MSKANSENSARLTPVADVPGMEEIASTADAEAQTATSISDEIVAESTAVDAVLSQEDMEPEERVFGLSTPDQKFLATVIVAALLLMLVHWIRLSRWGAETVEIDRQESQWREYRVEINSANWVQWAQLEGIGPTLAQRIVADREANGPFESIDDLQRVKGIGPATINRIGPWLRVGDK